MGFGEAGTNIIIKNLKNDQINPLIKGKKVICIFGFCDIRKFSIIIEELREKVMKFVNLISEIVHSVVDKYAGGANKNLGDAYLLVWKFREEDIENVISYDDNNHEKVDIQLKNFSSENNPITSRCEMALLSFIEIIIQIRTSPDLVYYNKHPALNKIIPDYKVDMGFGLHLGWGIEGAIGSNHKIDASYLSPNVNLASRLEAATKQFNVDLLISHKIYDRLSK